MMESKAKPSAKRHICTLIIGSPRTEPVYVSYEFDQLKTLDLDAWFFSA